MEAIASYARRGRTPNLQMPPEWLSAQILRRNMAQTLCRNEPFYTYALCSGTEFDYPAFALGGDPYVQSWTRYARIGAPVDYLLAEDLQHDAGDYKLYIFNCCHRYGKRLVEVAERLRLKNCMIVWTYAPGYVDDGGNSVENMKRLTGLDFVKASAPIDPGLTLRDGQKTGGLGHAIAPVFSPVGADEVLGANKRSCINSIK